MATIEPRLIHLLNNTQTPDLPPLQLSPSFDTGGNSISLPPIEPDPGYRSEHALPTQIPPLLSLVDDSYAKQAPRSADNVFPAELPGRAVKTVPSLQQLLGDLEPPGSSLPLRMLVEDAHSFQDDVSTKKRHRGPVQKDDFMQLPQPLKKQKSTQQVVPPIIAGLHEPPPDPGVFPPINTANSDGAVLFGDFCNMEDDRVAGIPGANASDSGDKSSGTAKGKRRATKPRKKWSDEETNHLLLGVSRYGVGKWTSILEDTDFTFNGRTAGDLKDRFRTCCPDELRAPSTSTGKKQRAGKNGTTGGIANRSGQPDYTSASDDSNLYHNGSLPKSSKPGLPMDSISTELRRATTSVATTPTPIAPTVTPGATTPTSDQNPRQRTERELLHPLPEESVPYVIGRHRKSRAHRKKMEDLAELGIHAPFKKSHRRERRPFTEQDDKSILDGLKEYGPAWTKIQRDGKFNLLSRQPTDLRDRVRNKYPDIYASIEKGAPLFPKSRSGRRKLGETVMKKISESGIGRIADGGHEAGASSEHRGDSSGWGGGEPDGQGREGDGGDYSAGEDERTRVGDDISQVESGDGRGDGGELGGQLGRAHAATTNGPVLEPAVTTTIEKGFQHPAAHDINRSGSREQLMAMAEAPGAKGEQPIPRMPSYDPVSGSLPGLADMFDVPKGFGPAGSGAGPTANAFLSPSEMDISRLLLDDGSVSGLGLNGPRAGEYHGHTAHFHHMYPPPPPPHAQPLPLPHHTRYGGGLGPSTGQSYDHGVSKGSAGRPTHAE